MTKQITDSILMIRPVAFRMNEQTAVNNYYQNASDKSLDEIQVEAMQQFDQFVTVLRDKGVNVIVVQDTASPETPDSIFPNNWVSFHLDGTVCTYPMFAENRRLERRQDIIDLLKKDFEVTEIIDFTDWEAKSGFLEGTGSLILDRENKIAYAAISERTMNEPLDDFCDRTGFSSIRFHAYQTVDGRRLPIYHTNVMMCLGETFAVVCTESIDAPDERLALTIKLRETGKELIEISELQKEHFAGNMLQVQSKDGHKLVVLSADAYFSLHEEQKEQLSHHGELLYSDISTIEYLGGGSARCMMAEIFLPKKKA
jgi:hypothetical protein